jgi:DNA-binding beta-propeller fold protein YncE
MKLRTFNRLTPILLALSLLITFAPVQAFEALAEIAGSRIEYQRSSEPLNEPSGNLAIVAPDGRHITILNIASRKTGVIRTVHRIKGKVVVSADGHYIYALSDNGWVSKIDMAFAQLVAKVRVGQKSTNLAISANGKWLLAGNQKPHTLVVLDSKDLRPFKIIAVSEGKGKSSAVRAVYASPARQAFIVALQDFPQIWELSWDPDAAPVYGSFVHSFRVGQVEGVVVEDQPFARRRLDLKINLHDLILDPAGAEVIGRVRGSANSAVYNLDARRKVADLKFKGTPHFGAGQIWEIDERVLLAVPHLDQAMVTIIDMETWKTVEQIKTAGPGFFLPDDKTAPTLRFKILSGPEMNTIQMIGKRSLKITGINPPSAGIPEALPMVDGLIIHAD